MEFRETLARAVEDLGWVFGHLWDLIAAYPLQVGAVVAAWVTVEAIGLSGRKDPDRPRVKTHTAAGVAGTVKRARKKGNSGKARKENAYPVGGLMILGEFLVIIGGSGTGKTLRIIIPLVAFRMIEQRKSVLVLDPKGEIFDETFYLAGEASGGPRLYLVSTLDKHSREMASPINPVLDGAERIKFLKSVVPGDDGSRDSFFDNEAQRLAYRVAEALIAERGGADLYTLYAVLDRPDELDRLARAHDGVRSVWRGSDAQKGSHLDARSTVLAALFPLEEERVRRIFDTRGEITGFWNTSPEFGERIGVYLCVSVKDSKQAPHLVGAAMDHLMDRAGEARELGGPDVEVILEEAGTFGPLEDLNAYMNIMRGYGLNVTLVLQTLEQLRARIGHDQAYSALSAGGILLIGPVTSTATGKWIEELSGTVRVPRPRRQRLLIASALDSMLDAIFNSQSSRESDRRRGDEDDRIVVPRIRSEHLYSFEADPRTLGFLERMSERLRALFDPRWSLKNGQFFLLARGRQPTLLDTDRRDQIWPEYRHRVLPAQSGRIELAAPPREALLEGDTEAQGAGSRGRETPDSEPIDADRRSDVPSAPAGAGEEMSSISPDGPAENGHDARCPRCLRPLHRESESCPGCGAGLQS